MNHETFKNPERIFRGTDFWMLNDSLTEENIRHQLYEMRDKGVYSFIARTYIGLKSDYPGTDFKKKMHLIVDTAKECGLRVFVQAGYMPEAVLGLPEDSALRYIYPVKEGAEDGRRVFCRHDGYSFVEHNSVTFLDMFDADAMKYYLLKSYEEMWEEFADEYGKTILSVWVDEPSYNSNYLPFTPKLEDLFRERWGYELADKIWMLYFDAEGCESVRYHYRVIMRDLLEINYFGAVRNWCNDHGLLFSGHLMMEETLTSQICRAQACMPYYRYFDIPGIDVLSGGMNWVDDPIHPTDPSNLQREYNLYNTAIQCVSAANQAGKKHILAEMYGVVSENMTFRNQLQMFDSYAVMGINHRSVHGIFYSLHGRGKRAYPPHINYYQPFWKKYGNITDYVARVSAFISDGDPIGDIAVVHPMETGYMLYRGALETGKPAGGEEARRYDCMLYDVLRALKTDHRDVDLCDLASMRDMASVDGSRLKVGLMSYGTVILPYLKVVTPDFMNLLEKFAANGGKVIVVGGAPTMLDGVVDDRLAQRFAALPGVVFAENVWDMSAEISKKTPDFTLRGIGVRNVLVNHRKCAEGDKFFLFNKDCAHDARITLETAAADGCAAHIYNAFDGSVYEYPAAVMGGKLSLELTVPNGGSVMVSVEKRHACKALRLPAAVESVMPIDDNWQITPHTDNMFLLEYFRYCLGDGEFSEELPIMAIHTLLTKQDYRGEITLRAVIRTKAPLAGLSIALEDPELQTLTLDGREINNAAYGYYFDRSFKILPVDGMLPAGEHILEVKRHFQPLSKVTNALTQLFEARHGVELEPMYLLGDFTVIGQEYSAINGSMTFGRDFVLDARSDALSRGELTQDGYPFYTGEITLAKEMELPANARLRVGVMNAGAGEVYLNGSYVGDINRAPAELDLAGFVREGKNRLEIRLYSTLRNAIGPFHRPRGEIGNLFGGGYINPDAAWLSVNAAKPDWQKDMYGHYPQWWDNYNVVRLGVDDVKILFE